MMKNVLSLFILFARTEMMNAFLVSPGVISRSRSSTLRKLFEDEEEMTDIMENYVHAKCKESAESHGHRFCDKEDAREVLQQILPPVTMDELSAEVEQTLSLILKNPENTPSRINEDCFVSAVAKNLYWEAAGDLCVKELMYFDALHSYYQTGTSLLNDDDYEELKENLTWEGSSVPNMKADEALFVTAVASAKRGRPIMDDKEYKSLKKKLKEEGSWVTARAPDALERLGLDTFMGYLHRAL